MGEQQKEKKKLGDVLKDSLQKIIIFGVSVIYILQGLFQVQQKNTTLWDVLGSIALSVVMGVIISNSLNVMGLKDGRKSSAFTSSLKAYGEAKDKATPYFDKLQNWCEYKNATELELKRKEIIQNAGLKWKLYKIGYYDKHKPSDEEQIKALEKAKKCKIDRLLPQELLSDLPSGHLMRKRFGESEHDYQLRNSITDTISKIAVGVVCGMYSLVPLISEEQWQEQLANVLWNALQVAMWLTFGIMKYVNAKSFIENEYRQTHIIQKTEYLNEFVIICEKNPKLLEEYDDEEEISKFLEELKNEQQAKENIASE